MGVSSFPSQKKDLLQPVASVKYKRMPVLRYGIETVALLEHAKAGVVVVAVVVQVHTGHDDAKAVDAWHHLVVVVVVVVDVVA
jgi:hypothetical protein